MAYKYHAAPPIPIPDRRLAALYPPHNRRTATSEVPMAPLRIHPSGGKVFVAQARGPDGPDRPHKGRVTVGRHPVLSAEQARQRAALIIARVKAGEDPVPLPLPAKYAGGPTVADLAKALSREACRRPLQVERRSGRRAASSTATPCRRSSTCPSVERSHVMALHESLCETSAMANMVVETLSHMYALAKGWDMVHEDCEDPCQSIPMNPKRKRERVS